MNQTGEKRTNQKINICVIVFIFLEKKITNKAYDLRKDDHFLSWEKIGL